MGRGRGCGDLEYYKGADGWYWALGYGKLAAALRRGRHVWKYQHEGGDSQ